MIAALLRLSASERENLLRKADEWAAYCTPRSE